MWTGVWGDIPCPAHPRHPGVPPGWVLPICGCHQALCDGPGRSSLVPFVARRSCCCATPNPPTAGHRQARAPSGTSARLSARRRVLADSWGAGTWHPTPSGSGMGTWSWWHSQPRPGASRCPVCGHPAPGGCAGAPRPP